MLLVVQFKDTDGKNFWFVQDTAVFAKQIKEMVGVWALSEEDGPVPTIGELQAEFERKNRALSSDALPAIMKKIDKINDIEELLNG